MIRLIKIPIIILAIGIAINVNGCRKQYKATEQDMDGYYLKRLLGKQITQIVKNGSWIL
jgi:hypothetical protein